MAAKPITKEAGERNLAIWKAQQKAKPTDFASLFEEAFKQLARRLSRKWANAMERKAHVARH